MTNKKISALTVASTPLVGSEVLPVVQGGATVKATVANIVGAGTSPGSFTTLAASGLSTLTLGAWRSYIAAGNTGTPAEERIFNYGINDSISSGIYGLNAYAATAATGIRIKASNASGVTAGVVDITSDGLVVTGNYVPGTAAKGINFTANTPAAGMTSQLLNWYEEGTWTPNQGSGLTVVGAFSSNGTYVRIGRSVTVKGQVLGATTVAVAAAGVISSNLPFTAASGHAGSMYNAAIAVGGTIAITSTSATAASAITATPSITFTATYQV